ncbi:tumor necrosis factor receptor superfamily member 14-like [Alosa pseudoharengus]|uniref:tumor necrosis factor receptor superfamily member 14-like n=1 Tax=Alosa pseudoharengus TaxID=34774 RepID=UPI003F899750
MFFFIVLTDASIKLQDMSMLLSCVNITVLKSTPPQPEETMMKLVIIAVILLLTVSGVSTACGRAEYLIGQECCPMCGPGYYVRRHCTEFTSTTCVPCQSSFYTDAPNGLVSCRSCTVCDSTAGLRVKRVCSSTSDALCDPLEGHYCTDPIKDGCRGAVEHTTCSPGQYIKQPGTSSSDAVCADCVGDLYSDGSFTSCRPHTQCELMGLVVLRKGSTSYDTECAERKNTVVIIVSVIVVVIVLAALCGVVVFVIHWKKRKKNEQGTYLQQQVLNQETDNFITTALQSSGSNVHNTQTTQVQLVMHT